VSKATGLATGVQFPAGAVMGYFSLRHRIQTGSGAHRASYLMGNRGALTPGVKRPMQWSYISTSPIRLHGVVLS